MIPEEVTVRNKRVDQRGYVRLRCPNHPNKYHGDEVLEHRHVIEKSIGRFLKKGEEVHHKDGDTSNNCIENLHLCKTHIEHCKIHNPPRTCRICGAPHFGNGLCNAHCSEEWRKRTSVPCQKCGKMIPKQYYKTKDGLVLCVECGRLRHPKKKCKLCYKLAVTKGLCSGHYSCTRKIPCDSCGKMVIRTGYKARDGLRLCVDCRFIKT